MAIVGGSTFGKILMALFVFAINSYVDIPFSSIFKFNVASPINPEEPLALPVEVGSRNPSTGTTTGFSSSREEVQTLVINGVILARKGSKGILHKNMVQLNGHPLIYYALTAMIKSQVFNKIWISTDDPEVIKYIDGVRNYTSTVDIEIHHRASYTATDEATSLIAVQEFLNSHREIENVGLVQITSPFIQPEYLTNAAKIMETKRLDSIFSVTRERKLRWSEVSMDSTSSDESWTKPLNFNPKSRPRRQDWPGELVENGMFYFARSELIMNGLLQGSRSLYYEVPKNYSLEIDTYEDLIYAEILMKKKQTVK